MKSDFFFISKLIRYGNNDVFTTILFLLVSFSDKIYIIFGEVPVLARGYENVKNG